METTKGDLRPIEDNKRYCHAMTCSSIAGTRCRWLWTRSMEEGSLKIRWLFGIAGKSPSCGFQVLAPHSSSRDNPVQLTHA